MISYPGNISIDVLLLLVVKLSPKLVEEGWLSEHQDEGLLVEHEYRKE